MSELKKSRFTITVPIEYKGAKFAAEYQTLSGGLVLVEENACETAIDDPTAIDPRERELLLQEGILIPKYVKEGNVLFCWRDQLLNDFGVIRSKVMVTRRCNNRCGYCILGPSETRDMSRETGLAMDRFYLDFIAEKGARKVEDQYSGAEPTQNHRIIYESACRRSSFCRGKGIDYGFSMITNGVRLKRSLVERLAQVGLRRIHVSVAGPADIHNTLRPSVLHDGKTYEAVMENLQRVSDVVPVVIECQYDDQSLSYLRMPEMLDDLARRSIHVENVVFTPILKNGNPTGVSDPSAGDAATVDGEKYLYLLRELKKRGYSPLKEPPTNACSTDFMSRFVFNTEGAFIPCPALRQPYESRLAYGNVHVGIDFLAHSQLRRSLPNRCLDECELFPRVCSGGCRLQSLGKTGDFNGVDCQYEMLAMVLKEYIKEQVFSSAPESSMQ